MGHPGPHVSLWWITGDWQSCPSHSATSVNTDTSWLYHHGHSTSLVFLFLRQWSITVIKFRKNPPVGKSYQFASVLRSREALRSLLQLSSKGFLFSQDSPNKGFNKIHRSQLGVEHDSAVSARSRAISVTSQTWHVTAVYLLLPGLDRNRPQSVHAWTNWSCGHRKRVHRTPIGATLQLSQSVATAWSDGTTLDCAIAYNILLHQRDQALWGVSSLGSQDERERLRTAPFWASSLFEDRTSYSCGQSAARQCPIQGLGTFSRR